MENRKKLFEIFETLFRTKGKSYEPAKIISFYAMHGHVLRNNLIRFGTVYDDLRMPFGLAISSGGGKEGFIEVIEETAKGLDESFVRIVSLHPEQLIGKVIYSKKGEKIENKGYLHDSWLVKDDAVTLINDIRYTEARNYICTALNPIGKNTVFKRQVDQPKGDALKYEPECSIFFFLQPVPLIMDNLITGLGRRIPILYIDVPEEERDEITRERLFLNHNPQFPEWIEHLQNLNTRKFEWVLSNEVKHQITEYGIALLKRSKTIGDKNLVEMMRFFIQNMLIKFSLVNSAIEGRTEVTQQDVENACNDFKIVWEKILHHQILYFKKASEVIMHNVEMEIINYLKEKDCFSKDKSTVSINELKTQIATRTGKSEHAVTYHYNNLRKKEVIKSEQTGSYDSRVWISHP